MKEKYNLAFWGAGKMASVIVDTIDSTGRFEKYAVASRKKENAESFAKAYDVGRILSYDELLVDENIDIVYISTPTKFHYEHIKRCLISGKNVFCEKPLVENEEEARELIDLAASNGLLLFDGLWTMYMPVIRKLKELVGDIGTIKYATAGLGWPSLVKSEDGKVNSIYELWDYEIYPLAVMQSLFGVPNDIESISKERYQMNVENISYLKYDKFKCRIFSSLRRRGTYCLLVLGTKGVVICRKYWFGRFPIFMWRFPIYLKRISLKHKFSGYEYELDVVAECLDSGKIQSEIYTLDKTLELMKSKEQLSI